MGRDRRRQAWMRECDSVGLGDGRIRVGFFVFPDGRTRDGLSRWILRGNENARWTGGDRRRWPVVILSDSETGGDRRRWAVVILSDCPHCFRLDYVLRVGFVFLRVGPHGRHAVGLGGREALPPQHLL